MSRKKGVVSYRENPFLAGSAMATKRKRVVVSGGKAIVDTATGELENVAEVVMVQHVDGEQFVKLFTQNLRVFFDLTPGTMKLLQVLLAQVQKAPNTDRVMLNLTIAEDYFTSTKQPVMSKASFHRAVRELIEKQFIAETVLTGLYFINPNLFFNGDRVRFVSEIRKEKSRKEADEKHLKNLEATQQMQLGFTSEDGSSSSPPVDPEAAVAAE